MLPDIIKRHGGQLSSELLDTLQHAADLAANAISPRTRKLYDAEFKAFEAWVRRHRLIDAEDPVVPTTPAIVATYLAHLQRSGRALASANLVRAAIKYKHAEVRLPLDLNTSDIQKVMKGYRRALSDQGRKVDKAEPFTVEMFKTLSEIATDSLEDKRDLALIGLGIVRALRGPSELLALDLTRPRSAGALGALELRRDGATIRLTKTKTEQHDGENLDIENGPALDAVRAWVAAANIKPGTPLWRTFRNGCLMDYRPHQRTLHNIVQRRAAQVLEARGATADDAKTKAAAFSTHSLRHGALTSMGRDGASLTEIMSLSRHSAASAKIAMGYVKPENLGPKRIRKLGI